MSEPKVLEHLPASATTAPESTDITISKGFNRDLPCKLSDQEVAEKAQEMVTLMADNESMENEIADLKSQYKDSLKENAAKIHAIQKELMRNEVVRPVDCVEVFDWENNIAYLLRRDTGNWVSARWLTMNDSQADAFENAIEGTQANLPDAETVKRLRPSGPVTPINVETDEPEETEPEDPPEDILDGAPQDDEENIEESEPDWNTCE